MTRAFILAAAAALGVGHTWGAERHQVKALVLRIDRPHLTFIASCEEIPGYMEAMVMPFTVRAQKDLDGLQPSTQVEFTLVVEQTESYAEGIQIRRFESAEQEPLRAQRLQLLENLDNSRAAPAALELGQTVPDFTLTDQTGKPVTLSQLAGKVVAVTFMYTSCPLPEYCFRLSNNLGQLQKRFANRMGSDLVFLSISFNPVHDTPQVLTEYAKTWKADPASWHFLTGALPDVKTVCALFGVNFWPDEGTLTHSLHTAVIDRAGKLAANFEGNQFTAEQLGDFVQATLDRR